MLGIKDFKQIVYNKTQHTQVIWDATSYPLGWLELKKSNNNTDMKKSESPLIPLVGM